MYALGERQSERRQILLGHSHNGPSVSCDLVPASQYLSESGFSVSPVFALARCMWLCFAFSVSQRLYGLWFDNRDVSDGPRRKSYDSLL